MRESTDQLGHGVVLDYFGGRPRRTETHALPWWDESLFHIAGTMALVLLILPVIVVTMSVLTWLLLQL
jgi:hypothetical protein